MRIELMTLCMALCCLCLNAFAQNVPDYVPTDGLVAWYPFNGNANDESGNGNNGVAENVTAEFDRFGNENGAFGFQGQNCCGQTDELVQQVVIENSIINLGGDYTVSAWFLSSNIEKYQQCLFNSIPHTGFIVEYNNEHAPDVTTVGLGPGNAYWNTLYQHGPFADYTENQWYQVVFVKQNANFHLYIDGALDWESTYGFADVYNLEVGIRFGSIGGGHQIMNGSLDDCGIWNRTLTEEEILGLYNAEPPISGCTDLTACNFDSEATSDDGSCIPSGCMETDACNYNALAECDGEACDYTCCPGPGCCGEGTIWNSLEQTCESIPCETILDPLACGPGTFWDETTSQCLPILTCQEDLDGDGVIGVEDLMQLLSSFGTMCEDSEPETGEFTCSDPMNYHGYDYATVQIGDQCWFAENLRTEYYVNGDPIPSDIQDSLLWATAGAQTYFSEDSVFLEERGRMYNGHAVLDARGLCPTGWHVPSDSDFIQLEEATGMSEVDWESTAEDRGCSLEIGGAWKSQTGWYPGDQGTDLWGLSVQPSGYFLTGEGFGNAYTNSEFWTSTPYDATRLWRRQVPANSGCLFRGWWEVSLGSAIRCVEDTEE